MPLSILLQHLPGAIYTAGYPILADMQLLHPWFGSHLTLRPSQSGHAIQGSDSGVEANLPSLARGPRHRCQSHACPSCTYIYNRVSWGNFYAYSSDMSLALINLLQFVFRSGSASRL